MKSKCLGHRSLVKGRCFLFVLCLLLVVLYKKITHTNTKSIRFEGVKGDSPVSQKAGLKSSRGIIHGETEVRLAGDDGNTCRINGNDSHVLLTQKTSVFYCAVPKAASTYTKGFLDNSMPACLNNSSCFVTKDKASYDTFSFMWTRDPYSRLYSAYENKLFNPNKFWKILGTLIIKEVRENPSEKSLTLGHDVSFTELVKYVTKMSRSLINPHLQPISEKCNPCKYRFDFVGRLETFPEDFGHVCSQLQAMNLIHGSDALRLCQMPVPDVRLVQRVTKLFEILKANKIMQDDRLLIMERAWRSFQLRGYVSKNMNLPFTVAEAKHVTFKEYYTALKDSIEASKTNKELKLQKREAMIQAYMSVPKEYMVKLKEFVKRDCQIFGYDEEPAHLFQNRKKYKSDYDYFGGLL